MSFIALAISTAVGVGATLYAGSKVSKATKEAAQIQATGTQAAIDTEWKMFQQSRADFAPWREAGMWALRQLVGDVGGVGAGVDSPELTQARSNLQSLEQQAQDAPAPFGARDIDAILASPNASQLGGLVGQIRDARAEVAQLEQAQQQGVGAAGGFEGLLARGPGEFVPEEQPGFKFGFEELIRKPYLQTQAAKGKRLSGETLKGLTGFAQDYASTQYNNFLNRYYQSLAPFQSMAGVGQTATGQQAVLGGQTAGAVAGLQTLGAQMQAQYASRQGDIATGVGAGVTGITQNALQEYLNLQARRRVV